MLPNKKLLCSSLLVSLLFFNSLPLPSLHFNHTTYASRQEDEIVRVESDLVLLNLTVVDAEGHYVHKIPRKDFNVFEDGVRQNITTFAFETNPFAAAILIDSSGSMENRLSLARAAAIRFLDGLRMDDVATIYNFNSKVERLKDYTNERDLPSVAFDLKAKGVTKLHDAIYQAARDLSERVETRRAILVLSDGADTASSKGFEKSLNAVLSADVTVYAVNMTDTNIPLSQRQFLATSLKSYAEKSGGRYVASPGGRALSEAFEDILEELKNQYTLGYRPTNRLRDGRWRQIKVQVGKDEYKVRTRAGYFALKKI